MTKKLLALALAGTTAFSVFGGLNVFAANDDAYEAYSPYTLTYDGTDLGFEDPEGSSADLEDGPAFDDMDLTLYEEVDDIYDLDDVDNSGDVLYLYDFFYEELDSAGIDADDIADIIGEYDTSEEMWTAFKELLDEEGITKITYETGRGTSGTLRREVTTEFYNMAKSAVAPDNVVEEDVEDYAYDALYDAIREIYAPGDTVDTSRNYEQKTSELLYLIQQYNYIIDLMEMEDSEDVEERVDRYIDILDERSASDYDSTANYYNFLSAYSDVQEDYEDADTVIDFTNYADDLWDLIGGSGYTNSDYKSSGVDKSDLKSALLSLVSGTSVVSPDNYWNGGKFDTKALYTDDDYDTDSDEWSYFWTIYEEAYDVYSRVKNYSYQTTVDAYATLLEDAIDALESETSPKNWVVTWLEELVEEAEGLVESDYKSGWSDFSSALDNAQDVLSSGGGATKTKNAAQNLEDAMDDLTPKSVSSTLKRELKDAIEDAEEMLEDSDSNVTGSQVVALTAAIADGKACWSTYSTTWDNDTLISEVEGIISDLEAAMAGYLQTQGWYTNADGKWMYGEGDTYVTGGWKKINNCWYYFNADGTAKQNEWYYDNGYGAWFWLTNSCNAAHGWCKINGEWYFFRDGGYMVTGWRLVNGNWYYMDASGKMLTGWVNVGGKYYYLSKDSSNYGAMLANTTTPDGYKVGADGAWIQ